MDPKCCDAHYSFVYMDYKNSFWIDDKGEMITVDNNTEISENDYVKKADIDPQRKFRVTVGEGQCVVTEFEKDYDIELKSKELWRAYYKEGKIEKTGLMIGTDFILFKKFSQDIMTEYEYDYDIKARRITNEKREIYKGYYKNDPKNHYPRSDKKEEHKNESHQVQDIQSGVHENRPEGGVHISENKQNRIVIKTKTDYDTVWDSKEDVNEICVSGKYLKSVENFDVIDFPQLRTIVFEENPFGGKNLTLSNLPQLESISIGDYVFYDAIDVKFSSKHVLII